MICGFSGYRALNGFTTLDPPPQPFPAGGIEQNCAVARFRIIDVANDSTRGM